MKYSYVLLIMLFGFAMACGGGRSSALVEDCKAECLGKARAQVQECGENQSCKIEVQAQMRECENACQERGY